MNLGGLFAINEWLIAAVLAVVFFFLMELGFRAGRNHIAAGDAHAISHVSTLQTASLGLLALLLGFTFSLAANKFDQRRALLVSEANAIGTARLRVDVLPAEVGEQLRRHINAYVESKITAFDAGIDTDKMEAANREAVRLQGVMWALAVEATRELGQSVTTGLVLQSLNDMFDMHSTRTTAVFYRIPDAVFTLLAVIAGFAFALTGYGGGLARQRHLMPSAIMILLVAGAILLIVDLDRPQRGLFQINAQPLLALRSAG